MESRVLDVEGWEQVVHFKDVESGLEALISVHNKALGPGCGGCRIFPYESFEAGLTDVKNLSRGMTYKNALGGIPFGGGKAVIFANPKTEKTPAMLKAFARAVDSLNGQYYTAEDSGVTEDDMKLIRSITPYAAGFTTDGIGGNPSPFTARGVWRGMRAAVKKKFDSDSLNGLTVAIMGVGAVGMALARIIHEEGGRLVVADINPDAVKTAVEQFGATAVGLDEIYSVDADIFAPCALGGSINADTIDQFKAKIIAGAANNQLKTPDMDEKLHARGILYAPDYVINAAGVISVGLEILGAWTEAELTARIDRIGDTLREIFDRAERDGRPTGAVADEMAQEVIKQGRKAA